MHFPVAIRRAVTYNIPEHKKQPEGEDIMTDNIKAQALSDDELDTVSGGFDYGNEKQWLRTVASVCGSCVYDIYRDAYEKDGMGGARYAVRMYIRYNGIPLLDDLIPTDG